MSDENKTPPPAANAAGCSVDPVVSRRPMNYCRKHNVEYATQCLTCSMEAEAAQVCGQRYRVLIDGFKLSGTRHCTKPKGHKDKCGKAANDKAEPRADTMSNELPETTGRPVGSSVLLADAVRGLMQLMDDGDLVRNIEHDEDFMAFARQGMRITNALRAARNALNAEASANDPSSATGRE